MNRAPKGTDSVTLAKHNTTSVHIQRPKPQPLRKAGLHAVAITNVTGQGRVRLSPVASPAELAARRKSERLEAATDTTPVRNSTMRGPAYTCPELRANPYRPGSADAFRVPSLTAANRKV